MKVLVLTNMYPHEGDPSCGIFVKDQVDALRREGVKVDVLSINARSNKLSYVSGIVQFIRRCRRNKYDLIHAQHTFCGALALLQRKIPVILTFHEGEASATLKMKSRQIIRKPHKFLVFSFSLKKSIVELVDEVIFVAGRFKELFGTNKGVVIPCGIDLRLFRPISSKLVRSKLTLSNGRRIVLFPSCSRVIGKRFDMAQEAVRIVKEAGIDVDLISLNRIPHNKVPLYMNASDIMLFTSDYEASPTVIKEAMACNVPIVSTDVGDIKEIIGNTGGCFICKREPKDVALKIKMALNWRKRTDGRERIEKLGLGLEQTAQRIIKVYDGAIKKR